PGRSTAPVYGRGRAGGSGSDSCGVRLRGTGAARGPALCHGGAAADRSMEAIAVRLLARPCRAADRLLTPHQASPLARVATPGSSPGHFFTSNLRRHEPPKGSCFPSPEALSFQRQAIAVQRREPTALPTQGNSSNLGNTLALLEQNCVSDPDP